MTPRFPRLADEPEGHDELWTVADVARFLKVSPRTVYDLAGLPAVKLRGRGHRAMRRYDPAEVRAWARRKAS